MRNHSPMKILQLTAPASVGGLESVVLDLSTGLQALGHQIVLATVLAEADELTGLPRKAHSAGIEVVPIRLPPHRYLREYRSVRDLLRSLRPDVIHTHGYRADAIGGLAARVENVPWFATTHGFTGGGFKARFYEWVQVQALRRAHQVLAVSAPLRDHLVRVGIPTGIISVVPNAWSPKPSLGRQEARGRLGIPQDAFVIGWVGRLTHEKGADVFLDALGALRDANWCASMIGDGPDRHRLEGRARSLGIEGRVRWHGIVPDAATVFTAFDAWVLSSRTEGTPIALFEAMGAQVPVVATAVGGVPDVVSLAEALLVPPERPDAIAAALESIIAEPTAAAARTAAALLRVSGAHAPHQWLDAHVALYRAVTPAR